MPAKTRMISSAFWRDPSIVRMRQRAKLLALYLETNKRVHLAGIYFLMDDEIVTETGIGHEELAVAWSDLEATGWASREVAHGLVWVRDLMERQARGSKGAISAAMHVLGLPRCCLVDAFLSRYPRVAEIYQERACHRAYDGAYVASSQAPIEHRQPVDCKSSPAPMTAPVSPDPVKPSLSSTVEAISSPDGSGEPEEPSQGVLFAGKSGHGNATDRAMESARIKAREDSDILNSGAAAAAPFLNREDRIRLANLILADQAADIVPRGKMSEDGQMREERIQLLASLERRTRGSEEHDVETGIERWKAWQYARRNNKAFKTKGRIDEGYRADVGALRVIMGEHLREPDEILRAITFHTVKSYVGFDWDWVPAGMASKGRGAFKADRRTSGTAGKSEARESYAKFENRP